MSGERDIQGAPMRRMPQRARGQQRVGVILDVAEQLFAEHGYEATTTNELAARAAIPIGSVYQFFPNKEAILHAVAARYREGFAALYEQALAEGLAEAPLPVVVERLIDLMVEHGSQHIGVTRIVLQGHASPLVAPAAATVRRDMVERLEALLALRAPDLPPERRALIAEVGLSAVFALLSMAVAAKDAGGRDVMFSMFREAKVLLLAYLRAAISAGPASIDEAAHP
jgi:AcrR family transcriptional regulator